MVGPRTDLVGGGLASLLGVGVCVQAIRLKVGSPLDPQPGFFPFVGGVLLVAMSAVLVGQAFWRTRPAGGASVEKLGSPATLLGGLVVYVWLLEWAGYPLMTALLTLLVLRVQDTRWSFGIAASVLLSGASYLLFLQLGVPLPTGRLFGS